MFSSIPSIAQQQSFKVFLVGDAGEDATTGETLKNLGKQLLANPNSVVIFLGDNCYKSDLWGIIPYGFKGFDSSKLTRKKIMSQLDILTNYKGHVFFCSRKPRLVELNQIGSGATGFENGRIIYRS
ncbi:MAG TPA: hypothetical protein VK543_14385 [Puia sp.]|nr:hypothetical protein [Puia sp.]